MLALLVCTSRACRAALEAEGSRQAIAELVCEDCGARLHPTSWADAGERRHGPTGAPGLRRAA